MRFFNRSAGNSNTTTAVPSTENSMEFSNANGNGNGVAEKGGLDSTGGKVPGITLRTVFMAILVAMGGFIFGYDTGQISGFLDMPVFLARFGQINSSGTAYFSDVRSGLIVGLLSIGTLCGCLIAGPLANKFGRKWCVPPWCIIFCVGVIVQISAGNGDWVSIMMGRWVAGLGVGALSVLVPLYMSETSPVPVRGAVVSCYQLFVTLGIFVADCINYGTETRTNTASYRIPMGIGFIWPLVLGVGIMFLPESPRHDWNNDKQARARTTMSQFYGVGEHHPLIEEETAEIEKVRIASQGDHPWYEAITGPRMLYRVLLAMGLQMFQQLTGANYFFYYGTSIFRGVGISNSYVTAMILGGVNFGSTIVGVYAARWFRRRPSLWIAGIWQTMCFLIFASVGEFLYRPATDSAGNALPGMESTAHTAGTVMIVFACFFICSFAMTWGPLVWACIGELFPYKYRAVGMALATSANWFWNFLLAFFTPFITGDIHYAYGYVFAGCNLAGALLVYFFLMETSGRTLEEVDAMYLLHVNPRKSAKFEFDEETKASIGKNINTDAMNLKRRGNGFAKADESGVGGVLHDEGKFPDEVLDVSNTDHPATSAGANGRH